MATNFDFSEAPPEPLSSLSVAALLKGSAGIDLIPANVNDDGLVEVVEAHQHEPTPRDADNQDDLFVIKCHPHDVTEAHTVHARAEAVDISQGQNPEQNTTIAERVADKKQSDAAMDRQGPSCTRVTRKVSRHTQATKQARKNKTRQTAYLGSFPQIRDTETPTLAEAVPILTMPAILRSPKQPESTHSLTLENQPTAGADNYVQGFKNAVFETFGRFREGLKRKWEEMVIDRQDAAEDRRKAAEDRRKAAEDRQKAAEDRQRMTQAFGEIRDFMKAIAESHTEINHRLSV
ncbi:uncharacterized protein Triagg1_1382 [Trichoderma aggressivum f. europaeum]|uniref:Uncharacterized protein n=1 Tax=Trichoderma aggressivum f. europaeum TaxID=173218 RepID=A0AAE1IIN8_9HYPO|nr:hypothetical protein Triagg1_1382 [Trichoderma aggressivum f. europaeum]